MQWGRAWDRQPCPTHLWWMTERPISHLWGREVKCKEGCTKCLRVIHLVLGLLREMTMKFREQVMGSKAWAARNGRRKSIMWGIIISWRNIRMSAAPEIGRERGRGDDKKNNWWYLSAVQPGMELGWNGKRLDFVPSSKILSAMADMTWEKHAKSLVASMVLVIRESNENLASRRNVSAWFLIYSLLEFSPESPYAVNI